MTPGFYRGSSRGSKSVTNVWNIPHTRITIYIH
jgi:hypothetical protein